MVPRTGRLGPRRPPPERGGRDGRADPAGPRRRAWDRPRDGAARDPGRRLDDSPRRPQRRAPDRASVTQRATATPCQTLLPVMITIAGPSGRGPASRPAHDAAAAPSTVMP